MLKIAAFTIALVLVPTLASAQHQHHGAAAKKESHAHAQHEGAVHASFLGVLVQKKAELDLTDDQIAKLEDFSARMAQHHKASHKAGAKHDEADMAKVHEELMGLFTEAQLAKIRPLMKQHMESMCKADDTKQCKTESRKAPIE